MENQFITLREINKDYSRNYNLSQIKEYGVTNMNYLMITFIDDKNIPYPLEFPENKYALSVLKSLNHTDDTCKESDVKSEILTHDYTIINKLPKYLENFILQPDDNMITKKYVLTIDVSSEFCICYIGEDEEILDDKYSMSNDFFSAVECLYDYLCEKSYIEKQ